MEMNGMNERGYKIKGPHWNALHCYIPTGTSKVNSSPWPLSEDEETVWLVAIHPATAKKNSTLALTVIVYRHQSPHPQL